MVSIIVLTGGESSGIGIRRQEPVGIDEGLTNTGTLSVVGGGAASQSTLLIDGYDPIAGQAGTLAPSLTVAEECTSTTSGVVSVFQSQSPGTQYPELNYS